MMVSVILLTYNHERYIAQALDSVLSQETPFEFEVLLTEDCSTDRTREIVTRYASSHPHRIRLFLSERNLNTNEVTLRALRAARGDYVAFLDGDDYWTSPRKLERQVEFMEQHRGYTLCFHNAIRFWDDGSHPPELFNNDGQAHTSGINDLLSGNFIAACSPLIRRSALCSIPAWYEGCPFGDTPLYMFAAQHGPIAFLPDTMAAYRVHSGGLWSGASAARQWEGVIELSGQLRRHLGAPYEQDLVRLMVYQYFELSLVHARNSDYRFATRSLHKCLHTIHELFRMTRQEGRLARSVLKELWGRPNKRLPVARALVRGVLSIRPPRRRRSRPTP